jgi:hypothetical protein
MRWLNTTLFTAPELTRRRIVLAYVVAVATDALQLILGPFGWAGADEILDGLATVATMRLLGFHPLLLPTFVIELLPIADVLPTWTGCVALVIALRRRQMHAPPPPTDGTVIDV